MSPLITLKVTMIVVLFQPIIGFEPISTIAGAGSALVLSVAYATWDYTKCHRRECCTDSWIKLNYSGLVSTLKRSVHGQHLVEQIVPKALKGHFQSKSPPKALVMGFHGWTGSGKNFVSKLIADNLYVQGAKSQYVHWYISTADFPHRNKVDIYKDKLQKEIQEATKLCGRSLFIFDEMDKMPSGVIDIIKPFLDYYDDIGGIDYRKNVFIFLSNAGGNEISRVAYKFWLEGKDRESIKMKDIESAISKGAFNEVGGLRKSEIIKRSLIDFFVPFLPLERKHVQMCVRDELRSRFKQANSEEIDMITDQLDYYPPEFLVYSSSGCKKVSQKVDIYTIDDDDS